MLTLTDLGYDFAEICRAAGIFGFVTYVLNYVALSLRLVTSESTLYFALNITAASLVLVSLSQDFNLASALIQGFWILIGSVAILVRWRRPALVAGRPDKAGL